jgi:anti-anti-sigma regulatory factor
MVREENNVLIRFHHKASFLNKSVLKKKLNGILPSDSVLLDFTNCSFMDSDIVDILNDFLIHASISDINIEMQFVSESQEISIMKNLTIPAENGR